MDKLDFSCPKCESTRLEEIMSGDLVVTTVVNWIGSDGVVDYGEQFNEGGYVVRYQCSECSYCIVDDTTCGDDPLDDEALVKAIKKLIGCK